MPLWGLREPLAGISVVALEQAVSMPFCSFMLGELGATVIKIERPGTGDVLRGWDDVVDGLSSGYVWLNANKRDIAVDAGTEQGGEIVRGLIERADVFLENLTPGAAGRLGVGPDRMLDRHPGLVYCSLSGYGQDGPYRDRKAYDLLIQGESGILLTNGYPEAPAKVGLPITDLIAGSNAALGVLSAIIQRGQTGVGSYLDVSMLESSIPWLGYYPHRYWHAGEEPPRSGMRHQYICPYGPYLTADERYINLVVASDDDWERFCNEVLQRPEWLEEPRFASAVERHRNRELVERSVESVIVTHSRQEWAERLSAARLPYGLVRTIAEVIDHPQLRERGAFVDATSEVGLLQLAAFPLGDPNRTRHIPSLGEHTDDLLGELGYDSDSIGRLRAKGVVE